MNAEFNAKDFAKAIKLIDGTEFVDMSSGKPQPISAADSLLIKATILGVLKDLAKGEAEDDTVRTV